VTYTFTHNVKDSITKFGYAPIVPGAVTDEAAVAEGWIISKGSHFDRIFPDTEEGRRAHKANKR
jgi:hypothetical protein